MNVALPISLELKITHTLGEFLFKAEWKELNPDPQSGAEYQHLDAAFAWGVIYENSGKTTIEFTNFAPNEKEGVLSLTFH